MSLDATTFARRRDEVWRLAVASLERSDLGVRLFAGWALDDVPEVVAEVWAWTRPDALAVDATRARLARAHKAAVVGAPADRVSWAMRSLRAPVTAAVSAADVATAVRVWLAWLGDEHRLRHEVAWARHPWPRRADDERAARTWRAVLDGSWGVAEERDLRLRAGPGVRAAFRALGRTLGLPPHVIEATVERAQEALAGLVLGAHHDVAARILETGGAPLAAAARALPDAADDQLHAGVAQRSAWAEAVATVGGLDGVDRDERLATAARVVLVRRCARALATEPVRLGGPDLPGWSLVRAHTHRMRGRLRALLAAHPEALGAAVAGLPGLAARTDAAFRRWAWAWAWREARVGFAFDVDGLAPAPCRACPEARTVPRVPLGARDEDAVRTWLLCMLGRGCWGDLERWLAGVPGRSLSTSFYRYLAVAPDGLADPDSGRTRSYERLRDHLADGGLDAYLDDLAAAARDVRGLVPGRGLKQALHQALDGHWDADAVPLPEHHLPQFVRRVEAWPG